MEVFPLSSRGYEILLAIHLLGRALGGHAVTSNPMQLKDEHMPKQGVQGKKEQKAQEQRHCSVAHGHHNRPKGSDRGKRWLMHRHDPSPGPVRPRGP